MLTALLNFRRKNQVDTLRPTIFNRGLIVRLASPQPLPYHENGTVNITARPSTPVTIYNAPGPLYISSSYLFTVKEPPRPLPAMARHYDRETLLMERIKDKTIPSSLEQDGLSQDIQSFCIPLFGTTNVKIKQQLEKWRDKKYKDERTWPRLEGFKNATLQVVGWVRDQSHACQVRVVFCVFDKSKRDVTKYSLLRWDEVMFKVICFSSAEGETLRKMFSDKVGGQLRTKFLGSNIALVVQTSPRRAIGRFYPSCPYT